MNAYDLYTFYIEPADLKGQSHKVKVESVEVAEVFNPGRKKNEKKIVLHLAGKKKVLSLNKTRTGQMISICGTPEIEQWVGVEITIEPSKQSGKDTITIKVPQQTQAPTQPPTQPATKLETLQELVATDPIRAYADICKMAGIDQVTATAILRECGGAFEDAFAKVTDRYQDVLA